MDNNRNNEKEPKIGWIGILLISFILSIIFTGILAYSTDHIDTPPVFVDDFNETLADECTYLRIGKCYPVVAINRGFSAGGPSERMLVVQLYSSDLQ